MPKNNMDKCKFYRETSPGIYQRHRSIKQYIIAGLLLFAIGGWFFIKTPSVEGYVVTGITAAFGLGFMNRVFNSLTIDLNSQTIIQKNGLLSATQKIAFSHIQSFSISNRIYVLILISSALALVEKEGKSKNILLGQSFMNTKYTEQLLLETEKIMGRR